MYNASLIAPAKSLRKRMTKEERHLWYDFLKNLPVTVKRQKVIGKYIADFYIASIKTVIEIDGSGHYSETGAEYDCQRDAFLNSLGIRVLRYSNISVNQNFEGVCNDILSHL